MDGLLQSIPCQQRPFVLECLAVATATEALGWLLLCNESHWKIRMSLPRHVSSSIYLVIRYCDVRAASDIIVITQNGMACR